MFGVWGPLRHLPPRQPGHTWTGVYAKDPALSCEWWVGSDLSWGMRGVSCLSWGHWGVTTFPRHNGIFFSCYLQAAMHGVVEEGRRVIPNEKSSTPTINSILRCTSLPSARHSSKSSSSLLTYPIISKIGGCTLIRSQVNWFGTQSISGGLNGLLK